MCVLFPRAGYAWELNGAGPLAFTKPDPAARSPLLGCVEFLEARGAFAATFLVPVPVVGPLAYALCMACSQSGLLVDRKYFPKHDAKGRSIRLATIVLYAIVLPALYPAGQLLRAAWPGATEALQSVYVL